MVSNIAADFGEILRYLIRYYSYDI